MIIFLSVTVFLLAPIWFSVDILLSQETRTYRFSIKLIVPIKFEGDLDKNRQKNAQHKKTLALFSKLVFIEKISAKLISPFENVASAAIFGAFYHIAIDSLFSHIRKSHKETMLIKTAAVDTSSMPQLSLSANARILIYELIILALFNIYERTKYIKEKTSG